MAWSVTVNDIEHVEGLTDEILTKLSVDNPVYAEDAKYAFLTAKGSGLVSATLSGGRTPSPYGGPDTVVISVVGFDSHAEAHAVPPQKFNEAMQHTLMYPEPDLYYDEDWAGPGWQAPYEGDGSSAG